MPADLTIEQLAAADRHDRAQHPRPSGARAARRRPRSACGSATTAPEHVAQLKLIHELQDDGFNLAGIKRLLDDDQATAQRLARFRHALTATTAEPPQTLTVDELGRRFRVSAEEAPTVLARAETAGRARRRR